ncbi:xylulokinase [Gloeocapsopsis sp. IPPAS B-1203]|uniref:xylulokinase n=1 Tax=Gloeocapsopsis sp. IPPAS B-1203 TaxID=2049454 RepID=UPI000C191610|nr:xylulokinase [Gloeocapsopsis sp. IPPAS B-1203]PIG92106.1 xylulokinase [Gloeocapsopsis sp. IPPAS B-1203]
MTLNLVNSNYVVIGIDLGTSGVGVVAVNLQGAIAVQATRSYRLLTPHPGWTEQNPDDWIAATFQALTEVVQQLKDYQIVGLGLSGQMHGMVPLDAGGNVLRPAILWNDQRTGKAVTTIETIVPRQELIQRTGNPAITGFQLPKIVWLRESEPQAFSQMHHVLLPKDYLGYVLTGEIATEPSDASGVGCLNLGDRTWDLDILTALDLNPQLFPQVITSTAVVGKLTPEIASMTGLPAGLPIIAGGGDNAAAAIGLGISSTNCDRGSLSIGTSGVIFVPLSQPIPEPEGRVHLFCHADGSYHLLGVTLAASGSLRWYRDTFFPDFSYDELTEWASSAPPGSGGVIFLPHLAGERSPFLDSEARGAWLNLSLAHSKAEMTRAVLEGVAYSLRAALEVIEAIARSAAPKAIAPIHELVATGGGSRSALWLQIITDVLGINLAKPVLTEGAAYGAALLALVGCDVYPNLETVFQLLPAIEEYTQPNSYPVYTDAFQRFTAIYTALKSIN